MRELRLEYPDLPDLEIELRVGPGDRVKPGDILGVARTDKAEQELEAFEEMRIVDVLKSAGGYVLIVDDP